MQILQEQNLDKQLFEKGYVIIPFLDEQTVSKLKSFYYENYHQGHEDMNATAHVSDISFRMKMNDFIKEYFQRIYIDLFR